MSTAEVYGNVLCYEEHNEEILGKAMKDFLATKLHNELTPGYDLYEVLKKHLAVSMKCLGTN